MDESDEHGHGSKYLQSLAKFLKAEYMNKSMQDIFRVVDAVIKVIFFTYHGGDSMKLEVAIT